MHFKDLVEKMLIFDPRERISPFYAVRHPFFKRPDEGASASGHGSHQRSSQTHMQQPAAPPQSNQPPVVRPRLNLFCYLLIPSCIH